jgi:excisionase family DNA binding protein
MNLQATPTDARLAAYAPFVGRQGGTSLVRIGGAAYAVTVQLGPSTCGSIELSHGTGFNPELGWIALRMRTTKWHAPATLSEKIREIRQAFGLNIKQLADVMRVTRVTIYDWLRQDELSVLRDGARRRLTQVQTLAAVWAQLPSIPGEYLDEPLDEAGNTLGALLNGETLPTPLQLPKFHQKLLQIKNVEQRNAASQAQLSESIRKGAAKILANPHEYGLETD